MPAWFFKYTYNFITLPDATQPTGKIYPFSNRAVTFENFDIFCDLENQKHVLNSLFYDWKPSLTIGCDGAMKSEEEEGDLLS